SLLFQPATFSLPPACPRRYTVRSAGRGPHVCEQRSAAACFSLALSFPCNPLTAAVRRQHTSSGRAALRRAAIACWLLSRDPVLPARRRPNTRGEATLLRPSSACPKEPDQDRRTLQPIACRSSG